ncbi:MAG: hypothetical protein CMJ74_05020 [Planctomycetaceae bacterium]|nr:hypothetical protein [Planctomycetaceae bacterium]
MGNAVLPDCWHGKRFKICHTGTMLPVDVQEIQDLCQLFLNRPWHRFAILVLHPRTAQSSAKFMKLMEVSSLA